MVAGWVAAGRPDCFGVDYTYYYHVGIRAWLHMRHPGRASAFSTLLAPGCLDRLEWPSDDNPFLDIEIWKQLRGPTFAPAEPVSIGIKHGIGLSGGQGHRRDWRAYNQRDPSMEWLRLRVGDDFDFYKKLSESCA
jgi:hypothetical protein